MSEKEPTTPSEPKSKEPDSPVIPDRSKDDRSVGWGDGDDDNDDRLQRERPPHW